jgi:HicB-like protein involved in pilus formation
MVPKWCHDGAMNLSGYVETLQEQLAMAAAAGGEEARALAERLTASLDSATRLVLLDALSAAAGEITRDMAPGSVDLRLRDREPSFVVTLPPPAETEAPDTSETPEPQPQPEPAAPEATASVPDDGDAAMARINLRLPEHLKARVEAAASQAGLSVNSWLVRAATTALDPSAQAQAQTSTQGPGRRAAREARRAATSGQHFTGWVR